MDVRVVVIALRACRVSTAGLLFGIIVEGVVCLRAVLLMIIFMIVFMIVAGHMDVMIGLKRMLHSGHCGESGIDRNQNGEQEDQGETHGQHYSRGAGAGSFVTGATDVTSVTNA